MNLPVLRSTSETALHIAAGANQVGFVEKLLDEIGNNEPLNAVDINRNTVLCTAAAAGSYKIVKKLLSATNNVDLPLIRGGSNDVQVTPAYIAAKFGHGAIALELSSRCETRQPGLTDEEKISLFFTCINNEIFGKFLFKKNKKKEVELTYYISLTMFSLLHASIYIRNNNLNVLIT